MYRFFKRLLMLTWLAALSSTLLGQMYSPQVININNPSFRRLVIAVPDFDAQNKANPSIAAYLNQAKEDFPFLLQFTGFFKVINNGAFEEKKIPEKKIDEVPFWKMISVDTVVRGKFLTTGKQIKLELTGLDVYRGHDLDKKVFVIASGTDLNKALKRYVDYLLESYTGKPGIFQSKIVFAGKEKKTSSREIYICDPDGTDLQKITKNGSIHISPSWHPDGNRIVFTSYESGSPNLYLYDLHTKAKILFPGLVTKKGVMNSGGKFSPQGHLLVYTQITEGSNSKRGNSDIYTLIPPGNAEKTGKRKELITGDGIDVDPVFSPDGKWLVYVSGRYGNPHLFRSELLWNSDFTDITIKSELRLTFAGWWNAMPAWSPDSQKIAFAGFDRDINRFDIFLMNNDGNKLERLTLQSGDNKSPSFSPNGNLLIFHSSRIGTASDRGRNQLYMMNQDGTEQRIISTGLYDAEDPKWGPYLRKD